MRIIVGALFLIVGLPLLLGSVYRLSQVGETYLAYPLQPGLNKIGPISLRPNMSPVEVHLRGRWIHFPRHNSRDALSGAVTLFNQQGKVQWRAEQEFALPTDESAQTRSVQMDETFLLKTFDVKEEGKYYFEVTVRKARSTGRHMAIRVEVGQHDYTLHVPIVGGLLVFSGFYLIVSGGLKRRRFFKELANNRSPLP